MGALIPNGDDADVIDKLNAAFSDKGLAKIRKHMKDNHDDMFAATRHLHRISYRLKVWPKSGDRAKGRWFVFLRDLLGPPSRTILNTIRDAVNDWDPATGQIYCVGIRFWARFDPRIAPPDYGVEISPKNPDQNGQYWMTITLLCDHEIDAAEPGDPSTPNPDGGETGPPQPVITAVPASRKRSGKPAAKSSGKKASKKSAKKASKKKK
jgi:hypothetical protein